MKNEYTLTLTIEQINIIIQDVYECSVANDPYGKGAKVICSIGEQLIAQYQAKLDENKE